jgi:pectate lyase-like protein/parallel beta helix pectate lyase-like protein
MQYVLVNWFGGAGSRVQGRSDRSILSRRQLLRRGGDAGVGALVSAAVLSLHSQDVTTASDTTRAAASPASDGRAPVFVDARDHGAVGDGRTDDTAALQAALDAVGPGGGTVLIPAGRYGVSGTLLIRHHNVTVTGEGPGQRFGAARGAEGTRLEAIGSLADGPMLRVQSPDDRDPLHGVTLRDFALDGMGSAAGSGIHYRSYRGLIEHVYVYNFLGDGLLFQGYPHWDLYDTVVAFTQVSRCGGSGLYLADGATDMHFTSCVVFDNRDNMQLVGGGSAQVTACHFYTAADHNVFFNGAGSRSKFANCKIEGAGGNGVRIDSTVSAYSDILFTGCNFASNSRIAPNLYDHFAITGPDDQPVSRTVISGCSFSTKSDTPVARYFIGLGASAQQTTIVGNNFGPQSHYGSGVIDDASPRSSPAVIRANGGYTGADTQHVRDTLRAALVAGSNVTITDDESAQTLTISSCSTVRSVTGDATLATGDGIVRVTTEFGSTVTVPAQASVPIPVGSVIRVRRNGGGEVSLAGADGVTLNGPTDGIDRYRSYVLTKVFDDTWDVEA